MHPRRLSVFLSSTFSNLREERGAVIEVINRMQEVCIAMEYFGSFSKPPLQKSLEHVGRAQLFVLVLADRYGFVPEGQSLSITELEYRQARRLNIPVLCYVSSNKNGTSDDDMRLTALKAEIGLAHGVSRFSSDEQLATLVATDLYREAKALLGDALAGEEDELLAQKHERVVEALLSGRFEEARLLNGEIFREHSGRSPRAHYNEACATSMLSEVCEDEEARSKLLAEAKDHFTKSLGQGIIRLIRLFHDDPGRPHDRILKNRGLQCMFKEFPYLRDVVSKAHTEGRVKLGGGCVEGTMPVMLAEMDLRPIAHVACGDTVLSWDAERGRVARGTVVGKRRCVATKLLQINGRLVVTEEHPILTTNGWRLASDIHPGMIMRKVDGGSELVAVIERVDRRAVVYDLSVSPSQSFSAQGITVHNKAAKPKGIPEPSQQTANRSAKDVDERIKQIVIELLAANPEEVTDDVGLDDLGGDSLDVTEVVMEIEEEFLLPEEILEDKVGDYDVTVGALVQAVRIYQSTHDRTT